MELIAKKSKDQYQRENKWDRHEFKRKMHSWLKWFLGFE